MAQCLECQKDFGSLSPHLRTHGLTKEQYLTKYPGAETGFDIGKVTGPHKGGTLPWKKKASSKINPVKKVMDNLQKDELEMFNSRYSVLFRQADMDPALEPSIRDIVMAEIYVLRIQGELSRVTQKIINNPTTADIQKAQIYQKLIKDMQESNLKSLNALNLTREKKQAHKRSPETTPSRIITNYSLTLENMTPVERQKQVEDEQDAIRRLHMNIKDLLPLVPINLGEKDSLGSEHDLDPEPADVPAIQ